MLGFGNVRRQECRVSNSGCTMLTISVMAHLPKLIRPTLVALPPPMSCMYMYIICESVYSYMLLYMLWSHTIIFPYMVRAFEDQHHKSQLKYNLITLYVYILLNDLCKNSQETNGSVDTVYVSVQ